MTSVKDAGIERRMPAWCRCIQLEEVTPDSAEQHGARGQQHNANSQAKRKCLLSQLFVVVDAMQIRLRNLRRLSEFIGS
jgi:hypothetical protein